MFENLRCRREGLTSEQAQQRLAIFGPNKLEEKKVTLSGLLSNVMLRVYLFIWLFSGSIFHFLKGFVTIEL